VAAGAQGRALSRDQRTECRKRPDDKASTSDDTREQSSGIGQSKSALSREKETPMREAVDSASETQPLSGRVSGGGSDVMGQDPESHRGGATGRKKTVPSMKRGEQKARC